LGVSAFIHERK
jgi:toxin FitB